MEYQPEPELEASMLTLNLPLYVKNLQELTRTRVFLAVISGSSVGVLGLTGVLGFLFYPLGQMIASIIVHLRSPSNRPDRCFQGKSTHWIHGITGEILTYLLCWTIIYNCVHVY